MAPFDPEQFFRFAADIVRDTTADEARLRSAISRAYYAVFLTTRDRLFGLDGSLLTGAVTKLIRKKANLQKRQHGLAGSHEVIIFAASEKSVSLSQQLDQLKEARVLGGDGSHIKALDRLIKIQLLVVDDFLLTPLSKAERRDLLEVVEGRYDAGATVIASQCPIPDWYPAIGDPTLADAIGDRLLHHAYRIELKGCENH